MKQFLQIFVIEAMEMSFLAFKIVVFVHYLLRNYALPGLIAGVLRQLG